MKRIAKEWNEDLIRCPLIFADEEMPSGSTTAQIRELVASTSRTLSRKFLSNTELKGAIRFILAANNDSLLGSPKEQLTPEDLEAIAIRFLHIEVPVESRTYLRSIGGQTVVSSWKEKDLLAQHALWLTENRYVAPGERFLVEGEKSAVQRKLATQSEMTGLICEWLAKHLDSPSPVLNNARYKVIVGGGEILLNASTVADYWDQYIRSTFPPSGQRVGKSIRHISTTEKKMKGGDRFWVINLDTVLGWMEDNQIGNVERIKEKIYASLPPTLPPVLYSGN